MKEEVERQENIKVTKMLGINCNLELLSKLSINEVAKRFVCS